MNLIEAKFVATNNTFWVKGDEKIEYKLLLVDDAFPSHITLKDRDRTCKTTNNIGSL